MQPQLTDISNSTTMKLSVLMAIFPGEPGLAPVKLSPPTNQYPTFYRPDALPVVQPTVSKHWRESITFCGLAYPMIAWGLTTLSLTTNSSWSVVTLGRVAMPLVSPLILWYPTAYDETNVLNFIAEAVLSIEMNATEATTDLSGQQLSSDENNCPRALNCDHSGLTSLDSLCRYERLERVCW